VLKYNRHSDFHTHCNHMRVYALGNETAVLMASYPRGHRPARPFPYHTEVMTGFEYCLAISLIQCGLIRDGLKVVRDIRQRYDGCKRSPFDEAECGHHYARAMASWGLIPALSGFHYSALSHTLSINSTSRASTWPWAASGAWGTITITPHRKTTKVVITVLHGSLFLSRFELTGKGTVTWPRLQKIAANRNPEFVVKITS